MTCPVCTAPNPRAARYCQQCGTAFGAACPRCQAATWPGAHYCTECGLALEQAGAPLLAAPPAAAAASANGGTPSLALPEERRLITVLFADVVGFTPLSEQLDPEEVRDLMRDLFRELAGVVRQHGGWIEKYIGDALVGVFGARVAREDDAEQALYCALALHQATAARSAALVLPAGEPLRLRIGVNTGLAVVGHVGDADTGEYGVMGDTVNTAARLQSAAEPEHTMVGEATWRAAQRHFAFDGPRQLQLKGKAALVRGYELLGSRATTGGAAAEAPLVGRESELAALADWVAAVAAGQGRIGFITGDTGIGKTRLLAAASEVARGYDVAWVPAQGQPHRQQVPGGVFQEATRILLGLPERIDEPEDPEALAVRLRARLATLGVADAFPFVGPRLGLPVEPDESLSGLPPAAIRARAAVVIERLWEALAREQPQIIALDDLHWADPSSLAIMERLLALAERLPLGLLFTLRADAEGEARDLRERARDAYPHRCLEITLGPLSREQSTRLVQGVLGGGALGPGVASVLEDRASGNPLYLEEIARGLVESGALVQAADGWALTVGAAAAVPTTLQATLLARLDRLAESTRHLLQDASVLGRQFALPTLTTVLAGDSEGSAVLDVDRALLEAQRAGLIEAVADAAERHYQFRHVLVQEVAYGTLLLRRRRELHRLAAEAIRAAAGADEPPATLAEHYALAELWPEAQAAATAAAHYAERTFAYREALLQWEGAWQAVLARGDTVPAAERAAIAEAWGAALLHLGEWTRARDAFEAALAALAGVPPLERRTARARLHVALAHAALRQGDLAAASAALQVALPALDPGQPLLSTALSLEAQVCMQSGHLESAATSARRALALALQVGGPNEEAEAYEALAHPALVGVIGGQAREYSQRWVELTRELGDPSRLFAALIARSVVQFAMLGAADGEIQADAEEALALSDSLRAPALERIARGVLGVVLYLRGDWTGGVREMTAGLDDTDEQSGPYDAYVRFWLGLLHTRRGELAVGRDWLEEGLARSRIAHAPIWLNVGLALNARLGGDEATARDLLTQAQTARAGHPCAACSALFCSIAGEEYVALGDPPAARACAEESLALSETVGRAMSHVSAQRTLALLQIAAGEIEAALADLAPALQLAETLESPYERARTAAVAGRARLARDGRGDRAAARLLLGEAHAVFEQLGAAPEAAACQALLDTAAPRARSPRQPAARPARATRAAG